MTATTCTGSTTQAWTIQSRGLPWDPSVLALTTIDVPTLPPPPPADSEHILVRVAFAGLNIGSVFLTNLIPTMLHPRNTPVTLEMDFSGTVIDVWSPNDTVRTRFARGDAVAGMIPASYLLSTGTGALQGVVRVPAAYVVHKPENVAFADAAGLIAGLTARQLVREAEVKAGGRVLVNAASGGIGSFVVQLVRRAVGDRGYIVGVCSGRNAELVKSLGADEVVDYTQHASVPSHITEHFASAPFDTVIDTLGDHALWLASPRFLRERGIYESVGIKPTSFSIPDFLRAATRMQLNAYWPTSRWLGGVGREWRATSMMSPTTDEREEVMRLLGSGEVRVVRDSVWAMEDVLEAYRKVGERHCRGKVVVRVDPEVADDQ